MNYFIALFGSLTFIFIIGLIYGILKFREEVRKRFDGNEGTIENEKKLERFDLI